MSNSVGLDSFLDSVSQSGEFVQTSEFTLDSLKAREKLSEWQLPDSGLWLVKLVQAAVRSQAPRVAIKFGKRQVSVEFENRSGLGAGVLMHQVLSGTLTVDPLVAHVVTGIRGSSTLSSEVITWRCGGQKATLDSDGSKLESDVDDGRFSLVCTRPSRQRSLQTNLTTSLSHLAKETVEEYEALHSRCWPCPIPIEVDGKELPRGYQLLSAGRVYHSPVLSLFGKRHTRNQFVAAVLAFGGHPWDGVSPAIDFTRAVTPEAVPELKKPVSSKDTFLTWPESETRCQAIVVLESDGAGGNTVDYVLDGALVERRAIPLVFGEGQVFGLKFGKETDFLRLRIAVPVDFSDLDLSQFATRGKEVQEIVNDCLPTVQTMVAGLKAHRSQFWYMGSPAQAKVMGAGFVLQTLAIGVATNGVGLLPMVGVGAAALAGNSALWRTMVYKALDHLETALKSYLETTGAPRP